MKVTSRSRPNKLLHCVSEYLRLAQNPTAMTWLITLDHDDESCNNLDFIEKIKNLIPTAYISFGKSNNKIHAINRDVESFTTCNEWHILLNISDDQHPKVNGYDKIIRESMPNDLDASLWFFDGSQDRINTQEIVGFNYFKRTAKVYNEIYKSFYCDNEATLVAKSLGKLIKINKCIIEHKHPCSQIQDRLSNDQLYDKNQKYWKEDEETFNHRKTINFGL